MAKLIALLALVAVAFGIAGLTGTTERASAIDPGAIRRHLEISCTQPVVPSEENGWKGEVDCSVTVTIPPRLVPPLSPTIKLDVVATYTDVDQSGRPSRGDRLQCAVIDGPAGFHFEIPRNCDPSVP